MRPKFGGASDRGRVREQNEDSFLIDEDLCLAAVADGMGGHNAGEVASRMAVELLHQKLAALPEERRNALSSLVNVVTETSHEIFACGRKDPDKRNMGSTLVALLIDIEKNRGLLASVGDSRAYLCREDDVRPLTRDHTFVQELINAGRLSQEEARVHPFRNVLSRAVGVLPEVEVDAFEVELKEGDRLLLCSDGLYGYLPPGKLEETLLRKGRGPASVAQALVDLANENGGGDNITAIVVDLFPEGASPEEEAKRDEEDKTEVQSAPEELFEEDKTEVQSTPGEVFVGSLETLAEAMSTHEKPEATPSTEASPGEEGEEPLKGAPKEEEEPGGGD